MQPPYRRQLLGYEFSERESWEEGFASHFKSHLREFLERDLAFKEEAKDRMKKAYLYVGLFYAMVAIGLYSYWDVLGSHIVYHVLGGDDLYTGIAGIIFFLSALGPLSILSTRKTMRSEILSSVAGFSSLEYLSDSTSQEGSSNRFGKFQSAFGALKLFSGEMRFSHYFSGYSETGRSFEVANLSVTKTRSQHANVGGRRTSRSRRVTIFQGYVLMIDVGEMHRVRITRNNEHLISNAFSSLFGKGNKVKVSHKRAEELYDFYCDDERFVSRFFNENRLDAMISHDVCVAGLQNGKLVLAFKGAFNFNSSFSEDYFHRALRYLHDVRTLANIFDE